MNKLVAILSFFSLFCSLSAQKIEVYGGVNHQTYYQHMHGLSLGPNQTIGGGVIGLAFSPLTLDKLDLRFTASLNSYHGIVRWSFHGQGASSNTEIETKNYDIGIGIFPFNAIILKHIHLDIGTELKILISDHTTGITESRSLASPYQIITLIDDRSKDLHTSLNIGVTGRIAYSIRITDSVSVLPQYAIYLGLSREFAVGPDARSFRQYFCLGLAYSL